ncbi:UPF0481 protein At3g47200-like [Silene latifolia]|uniref:UPF0481 protein At3g47200-like n=1 Tax=Silene latifolia TaxID=37657 RepID=UPI003D783955
MMAGPSNSVSISIDKQLKKLRPLHPNCSIYLVPENLRKVKEDAYRPLLVSIGPVYYRDTTYAMMHEQKLRYFQQFCKRCNNENIDYYREVVRQKENQARNYYVETIELPAFDGFVNMLLLDVVFIIELFLIECVDGPHGRIDSSDRIFNKPRMIIEISRDIRLEENQVPFFLLRDLYQKLPATDNYPPLIDISYKFFMGMSSVVPERVRDDNIKHLVDLLRLSHLPSNLRKDNDHDFEFEFTSGVAKLMERGVKFVPSESANLLDVRFVNGVLAIPKLKLTDDTESLFRNIMVFEQCHHYYNSYIIDYFAFLNSLINTPDDVEILTRKGIIENWLGNNEEVAELFSKLFKETRLRNNKFYYSRICRQLNGYAKKPWHYYITVLNTKYFNHPWSIIALVYAIVMLILTVLQVYTGFK